MNRPSTVLTALVAVALSGVAGCGAPSPATPPPSASSATGLRPRPATLHIDGVDPCKLLSAAQRAELGVGDGFRADYDPKIPPLQGTRCDWSTFKPRDRISYAVALLTNRGAEFALGAEPLRAVGGYAATATSSAFGDAKYECLLMVDVAPGRAMMSHYTNDSADLPGMTHQKACDNAEKAAEFMLANLRAAQPGGG